MKNCFRFIISGKVQGVYYRKSVADNAIDEGFFGYVKNLPSGDVEAVAMLDKDNFDKFLTILKKGSPYSSVKNIDYDKCNEKSFDGFEIIPNPVKTITK